MKNRFEGTRTMCRAGVLLGVGLSAALVLSSPVDSAAQKRVARADVGRTGVIINDVELGQPVVQALALEFGVQVLPGDYWYDPVSGLYGLRGGPGLGFTMPGMHLGGPLRADASGGGTNVFVNGRELHPMDVASLMMVLGPVMPGRYWLRWDGWYGWEGGPAVGNLIAMVQSAVGGGGGAGGGGYNQTNYFGHLGSDGQTSYFFDPSSGCSVISGGGVSC